MSDKHPLSDTITDLAELVADQSSTVSQAYSSLNRRLRAVEHELARRRDHTGAELTEERVIELIDEHGATGGGTALTDVLRAGTINLHVDPEEGDDSNDGTSSNPLATIQEAADRVPPINLRGAVRIHLTPGYYDEDITVGPYLSGSPDGGSFRIVGDRSAPEDYRLGSMAIIGCHGVAAPSIWGMTFTRTNDFISDGAALFVYESSEPRIDGVRFEPANGEPFESGIEGYSGTTINTRHVDVSNTLHGITTKRGSLSWNRETHGHAEWHVYWATEGSRAHWWNKETDPTWDGSPWQSRIARNDNGSITGDRRTLNARDLDVDRRLTVDGRQIE